MELKRNGRAGVARGPAGEGVRAAITPRCAGWLRQLAAGGGEYDGVGEHTFNEPRSTAETRLAFIAETISVGHFGEPEDIACVVAFPGSPLARCIAGAVMPADGGMRRFVRYRRRLATGPAAYFSGPPAGCGR